MNRMMKSGLIACALAAFALQPAFSAEEPVDDGAKVYQGAPEPKSYGYTVLALGIATPFSLPWDFNWDVFGIAANLGYSDYNKMYGWEFALGANTARRDMYGFQTSVVFNYANRDAIGAQVGIVNLGNRDTVGLTAGGFGMNRNFYGVQVNLAGAMTDNKFYGVSVSGLGASVREDMWGWQIAIGANFARRVHGLQTAALFNMTEELRGAQIGIVNYATSCSAGFQIGLANIIMDNQIPFIPIVNAYF